MFYLPRFSFLLSLILMLNTGSAHTATFLQRTKKVSQQAKRMAICAFKPDLDPKSPTYCTPQEIKKARAWVAGASIAVVTAALTAAGLGYFVANRRSLSEQEKPTFKKGDWVKINNEKTGTINSINLIEQKATVNGIEYPLSSLKKLYNT